MDGSDSSSWNRCCGTPRPWQARSLTQSTRLSNDIAALAGVQVSAGASQHHSSCTQCRGGSPGTQQVQVGVYGLGGLGWPLWGGLCDCAPRSRVEEAPRYFLVFACSGLVASCGWRRSMMYLQSKECTRNARTGPWAGQEKEGLIDNRGERGKPFKSPVSFHMHVVFL